MDEREGREEGDLGGAVYAGDILCQFFVQLNVPTMHVSPSTCFICICMPYRQDSPISHFVNVHGQPGRNIPVDLHMEHLNRLAKDAIKNLGSNKTVGTVARVGRCIGTLSHVLNQFDREILLDSMSIQYEKPRATNDITIAVEELVSSQAFSIQGGRRHRHYPKGKDLLESIPREELLDWMMHRLKQYV